MVRHACGVMWKPEEVPHWLVGALVMDSAFRTSAMGLWDPQQGVTSWPFVSFPLLSAEGDLAWDKEQTHEHLLLLDRDQAVTIAFWRLALIRHLLSSSCSLAINWSWSLQGSTLGATSYWPLSFFSLHCCSIMKQLLHQEEPLLLVLNCLPAWVFSPWLIQK